MLGFPLRQVVFALLVEQVQVGSATVSFDERETTVGDLVDAVYNAGYEASEAA